MGWFDKLLGQKEPEVAANSGDGTPSDARALERYRYLVRTAPPESLEEAHREAFSRLSPEQRARALEDLNAQVPASERIVDARRSDPDTLARAATRAELRQPGTVERALGGAGGFFAGSLLSSLVGSFVGTAIAQQLLSGFGDTDPVDSEALDDADPGQDHEFGGDVDYGDDFGDEV